MNLTRFSLFFPEKRDFFLEGRGIFDFAPAGGGVSGGPASAAAELEPDQRRRPVLQPAHRPQRGRDRADRTSVARHRQGRQVRHRCAEHRGGRQSVSATPSTNFTVARVKRDILRRSTIGAMFTNRSDVNGRPGARTRRTAWTPRSPSSRTSTSAATTPRPETDGHLQDNDSYQGRFDYAGRSLRCTRRLPGGRRQLQPGGRLRPGATTSAAPSRRSASARVRRAASGSASTPGRARSSTSSTDRSARDAPAGRAVRASSSEQRSVHRRGQPQLRAAARARSRWRPA